MKTIKRLLALSLLLFVMVGFSQCAGTKKLQDKAPMTIGDVYYQEWVAGIKGGGSGINIFVPVSDFKVGIDSVYFRGRVAKLNLKFQEDNLFIGRFSTPFNQREEPVILGQEQVVTKKPKQPIVEEKIPFQLEDDECVISYIENNKVKYFKIGNVVKKMMKHYPMSRKN